MTGPAGCILTLVTAPDEAAAEAIAGSLVRERLAACVTLVPSVVSFYRWEGKERKDRETLLLIKSASRSAEALRARIRALHGYEVPEIISFEISSGLPEYLSWLVRETK